MKIEFHVHTKFSNESNYDLKQLINTAKLNHIDCLMICDHNTIQGAQELQSTGEIKIIVGEEITTDQGEIIGLFLTDKIPSGLPVAETIKLIKAQNGLVCLGHPFDHLRKEVLNPDAINNNIANFDIIEIFNARTIFSKDNLKAKILAEKYHKIAIVGSDAHTPKELGRTFFEIAGFESPEDFLKNLQNAKITAKKANPLVHLQTKYYKFLYKKRPKL